MHTQHTSCVLIYVVFLEYNYYYVCSFNWLGVHVDVDVDVDVDDIRLVRVR